jgi:aryl-alcohol dehydrogenase-like predicted oxidoreductase
MVRASLPASLSRRRVVQAGLALTGAALLPPAAAESPELLSRAVPSTGVHLPLIGLGTNRYRSGDPAYVARLAETLAAFARLGGKVVDTAPAYGDSEQVIGAILGDSGRREQLFLATKVGRDSAAAARDSLAASYAALRTPRLDLVQLHNLRGADTVLAVLREQQAAGRTGHIGITTPAARQDAEMEAIMRRERLDFIQVEYAVGNRAADQRLLPLAADRGMAVLVNLPFGRGAQFRAVGDRPLPDWAAEIDCRSWAQVFLKYVVSHPAVTCAIPGSTQVAHVTDNLGAARGRLPDAPMRQRIAAYFDAIADG